MKPHQIFLQQLNPAATYVDLEAAARLPEKWTALGAIGFPSATARRLVRLGLAERRSVVGMCRMWDYRRSDLGTKAVEAWRLEAASRSLAATT